MTQFRDLTPDLQIQNDCYAILLAVQVVPMTWQPVPKAHNAPPTPHYSTKHETVKISNGRSDSFFFLKSKYILTSTIHSKVLF